MLQYNTEKSSCDKVFIRYNKMSILCNINLASVIVKCCFLHWEASFYPAPCAVVAVAVAVKRVMIVSLAGLMIEAQDEQLSGPGGVALVADEWDFEVEQVGLPQQVVAMAVSFSAAVAASAVVALAARSLQLHQEKVGTACLGLVQFWQKQTFLTRAFVDLKQKQQKKIISTAPKYNIADIHSQREKKEKNKNKKRRRKQQRMIQLRHSHTAT